MRDTMRRLSIRKNYLITYIARNQVTGDITSSSIEYFVNLKNLLIWLELFTA